MSPLLRWFLKRERDQTRARSTTLTLAGVSGCCRLRTSLHASEEGRVSPARHTHLCAIRAVGAQYGRETCRHVVLISRERRGEASVAAQRSALIEESFPWLHISLFLASVFTVDFIPMMKCTCFPSLQQGTKEVKYTESLLR